MNDYFDRLIEHGDMERKRRREEGKAPSPHKDHPLRHFDRTCEACVQDAAEGKDIK